MLLNNQSVRKEIKRRIKKYLETNEDGNGTYQILWDMANAVLRGKLIATYTYLRKKEKSQINNLSLQLKELEKEEEIKPKVSRRIKTTNIRV